MREDEPVMTASATDGLARPSRCGRHCAVAIVLLLAGAMLGACSKCDVPDWFPQRSGQQPQSCHSGPPAQ
jgi:hypothetical protein